MMITVGSDPWKELLESGAKKLDLSIPQTVLDDITLYAKELLRWNQKKNLTTITDGKEIAVKHFLDALYAVKVVEPSQKLLDIGTGGGFPGIPLKLMLPDIQMTLIDASRKKISFVKHIIRLLKLENIQALHVRAEELSQSEIHQHAYDVVVSRALSSLELFMSLSEPFLKEKGKMVALKSNIYEKEKSFLERFKEDNYSLKDLRFKMDVHAFDLPFVSAYRTLVILQKL